LHLAHNFVFARSDFSASQLAAILQEFADLVPDPSRAAWFFNNHDEPRTRSRFDHDGCGLARAELLALLLLTLPGTVFLYQGEELGLADTPLPPALRTDPDGRDPQRTPMPWRPPSAAGAGAGFTTGHPWLPVGGDADQVNAATEQANTDSTLHLYRRLIEARRTSHPVGTYRVDLVAHDLLVIRQDTAPGARLTVLNLATTPSSVPAEILGAPTSRWLVLSTDRSRSRLSHAPHNLELGPLEGVIIDIGRGH
jgi:alpha-glucosidase